MTSLPLSTEKIDELRAAIGKVERCELGASLEFDAIANIETVSALIAEVLASRENAEMDLWPDDPAPIADKAVDHVFRDLAKALGLETWNPQDGSETWEGDVWATMMRILTDAGVIDAETGNRAPPPVVHAAEPVAWQPDECQRPAWMFHGAPAKAPSSSQRGRIAEITTDGRVYVDYPAGGGAYWPIADVQPWGDHRDALGRAVREAWVKWAKTQPSPKASWLVPYDDLSEPDKEADRQIGEALTMFAPPQGDGHSVGVKGNSDAWWQGYCEQSVADAIEQCAKVVADLAKTQSELQEREYSAGRDRQGEGHWRAQCELLEAAAAIRTHVRATASPLSGVTEERVEGWQPIETLPPLNDYQSVMVAIPRDDGSWIVGEATWRIEDDHGELWWAGTGPGDYHASPISETNNAPTHWRPLPNPPALAHPGSNAGGADER